MCFPWLFPDTKCLDPSTTRMYVSRHVHFVESAFPFASLKSSSSPPNTTCSSDLSTPVSLLPLIPPPAVQSLGSGPSPAPTVATTDHSPTIGSQSHTHAASETDSSSILTSLRP